MACVAYLSVAVIAHDGVSPYEFLFYRVVDTFLGVGNRQPGWQFSHNTGRSATMCCSWRSWMMSCAVRTGRSANLTRQH